MDMVGTGSNTFRTQGALIFKKSKFFAGGYGLGIVAPQALHGATLQEYGGPDTRAVF